MHKKIIKFGEIEIGKHNFYKCLVVLLQEVSS